MAIILSPEERLQNLEKEYFNRMLEKPFE